MASPVTGQDATSTMSISPILGNGDIVTGVRGSHAKADGTNNTLPFLYKGPLTSPVEDSGFHGLTPQFAGVVTGTFYGPDTSTYNPDTIPARQVRAVGSYRTGDGVFSLGNLVVGNYNLNLGHGVSGNAFIYNMTTHQWTLLQLGGSLSSQTSLYGIWQNGGPGSPNYTLAGGSAAHGSLPSGAQRAFLMNYNERTGRFGKPRFYSYGNARRWLPTSTGSPLCRAGSTSWPSARLRPRPWRSSRPPAAAGRCSARRRGIPSMSRQARCVQRHRQRAATW